MAKLDLRHIYKVYPNGAKAVSDFNMEIDDKEFIVFVGPSGCGKSTTLRMIAGLEEITAGELYIDDELVNDMEPKERDIAMVFQNYALYPHMTVYDNMAFGLKLRHVPKDEIHKKVLWAAKILKLTEYLDRKPRAMSGGQRQRVALGRAILRNPKVFLLDEPLSNLDAKLRTEMRAEIAKLHNELQTTFIYVTHDQVEAMTLGTRVVVMKDGFIQQIDTPQNLYEYPGNKFVAGFIGTPQMNFLEATMKREGSEVHVKFDLTDDQISIPFNKLIKVNPDYLEGKKKVWIGLRCEALSVDPNVVEKSNCRIKVKISHFEELGNETLVYGDYNLNADEFDNSSRIIIKSYHGSKRFQPGEIVEAALDMDGAHFFDVETEESVLPRIPKVNVFDASIKGQKLHLLGEKLVLPDALSISDEENCKCLIPSTAIRFVENGIKAEVVAMEHVGETKICYLKLKDRVFFALTNEDYEAGTKVNLAFDYKSITIVNSEDKKLVAPLSERDVFTGTFTNFYSDKKSTTCLTNIYKQKVKEEIKKVNKERIEALQDFGYSKELLAKLKEEYTSKVEELTAERGYKISTLDLGKEGKEKVRKEYKELLKQAKADYKVKYDEIAARKNHLTPEASQKTNEINAKFDERIKHINDKFLEVKTAIDANKEHLKEIAKEVQPGLQAAYQEAIQKAKQRLAEGKENLNKEVKTITDNSDSKYYQKQLDKLYLEYDNAIELAESNLRPLYINLNGRYFKSNSNIDRHIISAMGISLFNTHYRFELNHYDYEIVEEGGIEAEVLEVLNYGTDIFMRCEAYDHQFYMATNEPYMVGQKIRVTFKLDDAHIYEQKFDIRLV